MISQNKVSLAVRAALIAGAAGVFFGQSSVAQNSGDSADRLAEVVVTGSRIRRDDIETAAQPVTLITREMLEESGDTSVADYLRDLPFNSFGSFRQQSGSSAQSFAGISLRGLGTGRTLILVDGRRAPTAPNAASLGQDLNTIPIAAVERIEILADGASAIYGSDAIGGVVNIITRRDYNGVQASVGISDPSREGGETEEASLIFGISGDRGSLLAGLSYSDREIIFSRERAYTARQGSSVFSNNLLNANGTFVTDPVNGSVVPGGCNAEGFRVSGSGASSRCLYDFNLVAANEAAVGNSALFSRGILNINDDWSSYLNTQFSRTKSFGRYAPVPSSPWPGGFPLLRAGTPNHPAVKFPDAGYDPTRNYFFIHRFAALGNRDTFTETNNYLVDWGFEGSVGDVDLEVGLRRTESQYFDLGRNYVVAGLAQAAIDSGAYNIYDPPNNPRSILNSMIATINRDGRYTSKEVYAIASTTFGEMAGGPIGVAFGGEYREDTFKDIYDTLQSSGQIVGSAGNSSFGGRDVTSFFVETALPVLDNLEVSLAARYDDYSDFGDDISPKVSVRWSPFDQLTLRASYGEGFRAPPLNLVSAQPSFSAASTTDARTCLAFTGSANCSTQVTTYSIANPNLEAELSEQYSFGFVWEPLDWIRVRADYWNIELTNSISSVNLATIIRCLEVGTGLCPSGLSQLPPTVRPPQVSLGLGISRDPVGGQILYAQTGFANLGFVNTDGIDLNLRTQFDLGNFGRLTNELMMSRTLELSANGGANTVGTEGTPRQRGVLMTQWNRGDWSVIWNVNYIHGTDNFRANGELPSWTTHDLQVNYRTPWNGRIALGVTNVADKDPVIDPADPTGRGYRQDLYNGYGRVPYLRYTQDL